MESLCTTVHSLVVEPLCSTDGDIRKKKKNRNVLRKLGKRRVQILASAFLEKDLVSRAQNLHLLPDLVTYLVAAALTLQDYSNISQFLIFESKVRKKSDAEPRPYSR